MTEQVIIPYADWTKGMLRAEDRAVVSRMPGIREWSQCFSATAARIDRFLQLGHEGSQTLPQSLVLDIIELDQAGLTDTLNAEGLLKNFVLFWGAVADVYGSTGTSFQIEAKRLDLLMEWSLLLTTLPGSAYPGLKLLGSRYRCERARLALTKLRKGKTAFAQVALCLQLVREHEANLGIRWDMQSASFARTDEIAAGKELKSVGHARVECGGTLTNRDREFSLAPYTARTVIKSNLSFELYGNWRDH